MNYNPKIHKRKSIRLKDYDYSSAGAYFVTICSWNREYLFGDIADGEMQLNEYGTVVANFWNSIPGRYPQVELDVFVIMPNHIHGIIVFNNPCRGGVTPPFLEVTSPSFAVGTPYSEKKPTKKKGGVTPPLQRHTLGQIVAYFKYQAAKHINLMRNTIGYPVWQRNYYEHIIRKEDEMDRIREYIINNPAKWSEDENNPENIKL